jgi:glucosamine kinase
MILIAESGSTKTSWVSLGKPLEAFETEGINPFFLNAEQIQALVQPVFDSKLNQKVSKIFFYGTGITDASKGSIVKNGLRAALAYETEIETFSDMIAAARAALGTEPGIACILGTGSNSCLWNGQEIIYQIPPLGFWLGDEGGGGHLGKSLVQNYLHGKMSQAFKDRFVAAFGELSRLDILQKAYHEPKPNAYFASYVPFIKENQDLLEARDLVRISLVSFIELYLKRYPDLKNQSLAFVGSIAHFFKDLLIETLDEHQLRFRNIVRRPVDGLVAYHKELQDI